MVRRLRCPSSRRAWGPLADYYPNPGTLQYSVGVQHQLAPAIVVAVQYVGSGGWNQDVKRQIDTLPLSDITDREAVNKGANANLYRIYPGFSSITEDDNSTNFSYNSLQAAVGIENKHGLTLHLGYTWAHEIDVQSDDLSGNLSDPFNARYDRGSGTYDRRNKFTANYIYHLPFFLNTGSMVERSVLGGWVISGITSAESGFPQTVSYGPDTLGLGGGTSNRPNVAGKVGEPRTRQSWFDTSAFSAPLAPWAGGGNNGWGNAGKDAVYIPGLQNTNLSLFKSFALAPNEGARLEIRFESFNTFNHTEWNGVDTGFTDGNFGEVTSTYDPRELQFGAKILF